MSPGCARGSATIFTTVWEPAWWRPISCLKSCGRLWRSCACRLRLCEWECVRDRADEMRTCFVFWAWGSRDAVFGLKCWFGFPVLPNENIFCWLISPFCFSSLFTWALLFCSSGPCLAVVMSHLFLLTLNTTQCYFYTCKWNIEFTQI